MNTLKLIATCGIAAALATGVAYASPAQDKKAEGGRLTFILARRAGEAFVARDVDAGRMRAFLVSEGAV